ncbi:MAG: serine hydrolase, partial [Gemmatimonadetes bacterium]|nr:serine hydrolase [Gemmatimonadota bacterium]
MTGIGVEEIDAFAQSFVQEWDILGAQFAVAREGKLVVATAYGFVDRARSDTLGLENVFRVASVSKPIT